MSYEDFVENGGHLQPGALIEGTSIGRKPLIEDPASRLAQKLVLP